MTIFLGIISAIIVISYVIDFKNNRDKNNLKMFISFSNKDGKEAEKIQKFFKTCGLDWCKVINHKNGEFLLKPDKRDNFVYTDEYLNYLGRHCSNFFIRRTIADLFL